MSAPQGKDAATVAGAWDRLSLNTATTKRWSLADAIQGAARAGIPAVGVWRDRVAEAGVATAASMINDAGLRVSSLCRGGFLTAADKGSISAAVHDNCAAIEEAAALGTRNLIMVVGGLPDGERNLGDVRARVSDRLGELVPVAVEHGIRLVLEALHPMYCADRAVLSTLAQALDVASPFPAHAVGVVIDTFHQWWDPALEQQIRRAANEDRIAAYQIADWLVPMAHDPLLSRTIMGDGVVDFACITRWMTEAGYQGDIEVEIFNADVWATDCNLILEKIKRRYAQLICPALA